MITLGVILILSGLLVYEKWEHKRTIDKLTNALIAKDARELSELNAVDKLKVQTPVKKKREDMVAIEDLDDKEFNEHILNG